MSSFAMQNYCSDGLDQMFECTGIRNYLFISNKRHSVAKLRNDAYSNVVPNV